MVNAKERISELRTLINKYDRAYYLENQSLITDKEYDLLFRELLDLEHNNPELLTDDSPTQRIASDAIAGFERKKHDVPMLSLSNTYSEEEIRDFDKRIRAMLEKDHNLANIKILYSVELKFDGVSLSLRYKNGSLDYALTRGDGYQGDDITHNVKTIRTLPLSIESPKINGITLNDFEVRGEAIIFDSDFKKINQEQIDLGEKEYANARNLTAGTLKLLDPKLAAKRKLNMFAYYLRTEQTNIETHSRGIAILEKMGFNVFEAHRVCSSIEEVMDFINEYQEKRPNLDFQIDGVVIKVDSLDMQGKLGFIARSPKWAIAYKYAAESAETKLNKISLSVGRTGVITPVAELKPVFLAGSTISRATLHNADYIEDRDIREGDIVYIEKGGDVIPKVTGVNTDKRPADSNPYIFPATLEDGTKIFRPEGEVNYYCEIEGSKDILKKKIEHFVSRKAMNIEGFGEKVIDQFVDIEWLKSIADIYRLEQYLPEMKNLDGWGEKSAYKLMQAIKESKNQTFDRVLFGLGIRFIGEGGAKILAKEYGSIDNLKAADKESLIAIYDIGEKMADSVIDFFKDEKQLEIIENLRENGINFEYKQDEFASNALEGKTFVFTGELKTMTRAEAAAKVVALGGKETKSVSKKTGFVVVGDKPGSKFKKAQELGITILNEDEFMQFIENYS